MREYKVCIDNGPVEIVGRKRRGHFSKTDQLEQTERVRERERERSRKEYKVCTGTRL